VYSVCTIEPEEGPDVIAAFLAASPAFSPAPIEDWPFATPDAPGTAFLYPHRTGTDGFFVAALRRAP
jgi:16S rRNA (cytosine967-C5)-methyltransferase